MLSTTTYKSMTRSCCSSSPRPSQDTTHTRSLRYRYPDHSHTCWPSTKKGMVRISRKSAHSHPQITEREDIRLWNTVIHSYITFDSDQPANNVTGHDTSVQQTGPNPVPPQHTRGHLLLPHRLNSQLVSTDTPVLTWIHTWRLLFPGSKEAVDPQSNMTLRQEHGHKELYENEHRLETRLTFTLPLTCQSREGHNI